MNKNKYLLLLFLIILAFTTSSCGVIDQLLIAIGFHRSPEMHCTDDGRFWNTEDDMGNPLEEPVCSEIISDDLSQHDTAQSVASESQADLSNEDEAESSEEGKLTLEQCNAAEEFSLIVDGKTNSQSGDTITCTYLVQTVNLSDVGVVLSYYYTREDEGEIISKWEQWYYDPSEELDWPLSSIFHPDEKSLRYWEKFAVHYSGKACDWVDWDDNTYEKIAVEINNRPCLAP